jgi:hypothetical protein
MVERELQSSRAKRIKAGKNGVRAKGGLAQRMVERRKKRWGSAGGLGHAKLSRRQVSPPEAVTPPVFSKVFVLPPQADCASGSTCIVPTQAVAHKNTRNKAAFLNFIVTSSASCAFPVVSVSCATVFVPLKNAPDHRHIPSHPCLRRNTPARRVLFNASVTQPRRESRTAL